MKAPIKNFILKDYPKGNVTQWFAENVKLYRDNVPGLSKGHNGIDIVAPYGTPIYATTTQTVVEIKDSATGYGRHIRCLDDKYEHTYGHLSLILKDIKIGDIILQGQKLGEMGNTGFVISGATPYWEYNPYAGTHLHYGIREFVKRTNGENYNIQYSTGTQGTILNYNNGWLGSIDPTQFFKVNDIKQLSILLWNLRSSLKRLLALLKLIQ